MRNIYTTTLMLTLGLVGCGGSSNKDVDNPPPIEPPEPVECTVLYENSSVEIGEELCLASESLGLPLELVYEVCFVNGMLSCSGRVPDNNDSEYAIEITSEWDGDGSQTSARFILNQSGLFVRDYNLNQHQISGDAWHALRNNQLKGAGIIDENTGDRIKATGTIALTGMNSFGPTVTLTKNYDLVDVDFRYSFEKIAKNLLPQRFYVSYVNAIDVVEYETIEDKGAAPVYGEILRLSTQALGY